MKRDLQIPEEVDERLKEWAAFFRDRASRSTLGSAESRYKPHSDDYAAEGWGDPEAVPVPAPRPRNWVLRAQEVQDVMTTLAKSPEGRRYAWVLTYAYAYPYLPRFVVLRCIKKFTGQRLTWATYLDVLDIGRLKVSAMLETS